MIQVYKENNTNYDKNGDCVLMPSDFTVNVTLNESWSATLVHPIDPDGRWNYLTAQAVVKFPSWNGEQLFRIKTREKSLNEVSCKLEPIFFDSGGDCWLRDVRPTNATGQTALNMMVAGNVKYSAESDIETRATAYYWWETLLEAISGDKDNSFLTRWGGEILYDNFKIIINTKVGEDKGVEIRYSKNLAGISETVDMTELVTRIWAQTYCGHPLRIGYVTSPLENDYPIVQQRLMVFDNIRYIADITDEAKEIEEGRIVVHNQDEIDLALYQACVEQFAAGIDKPVITLDVDMVELRGTPEYEDIVGLESVSLGDTVHVFADNIGIVTDMRVFNLEYDVLRGKVTKVKLGSEGYNYFKNQSKDIRITQNALADAQVSIAEINSKADETEMTLSEVTEDVDDQVRLNGAKLQGANWYGTSQGIVFGEVPTRSGSFRMLTEDGQVLFQYLPTGEPEWQNIGYLQRAVDSSTGANVLGMKSAPNDAARIWLDDEDKYVWLASDNGKINIYANNGEVNILGDDIELDRGNQVFHPFWVEQVPVDASYGWQYVSPPAGSSCHYLIQAAYYGTSSSYYITGVINYASDDQWILLFNTAVTSGYVTCIWI